VKAAISIWGIEHAREPPRADEPVHGEAAMLGTKVWLNRYSGAPPDGLLWIWRFPDDDPYTLRASKGSWELSRDWEDGAAVTVEANQRDWATFLTTPRDKRKLPTREIRLEGTRQELRRFAKAFKAELA
jgi:hypothetical protein